MDLTMAESPPIDPKYERRREAGLFLLLTVVLFPVLAVLVVAGYGFAVWMSQLLLFGPPSG
jgi:periplasmic nitrate reductase NapE